MAEAFAFFKISRTVGNLTFYVMEGRNFVRKKSSLTRRKVLYSPQFERTRQNASLMGQASKIGSYLYNSLPVYWRQSWMYRSFTGEAFTLLKEGKEVREVKQILWIQYVREVDRKQTGAQPILLEPVATKRAYKKQNTNYWETKSHKSIQRKSRNEQRQRYADLLAEASKIASGLFRELPAHTRKRSDYQQLTGWAMRWLKEQQEDEVRKEAAAPLAPPGNLKSKKNELGFICCEKGIFYLIANSYKRLLLHSTSPPAVVRSHLKNREDKNKESHTKRRWQDMACPCSLC